MNDPNLILASGSPRRQELIRTFGLAVRIDPADVDESVPERTPPDVTVEKLSLRKAVVVNDRAPEHNRIVIGSDTIVVLDGRVMGKPRDAQDAAGMLRALSGRTHQVYTGVACMLAEAANMDRLLEEETMPPHQDMLRAGASFRTVAFGQQGRPIALVGCSVSNVTFRSMSDAEIAAYVRSGESLDKAGSYGVQGLGAIFIEKIEGDFYSVMGLPVNLLYRMLLELGVSPLRL
ncbi:MAG: hypothetical protein K0Q59_2917 [Paenibacillus sp.]|jgi:septum formation protein|nr:hypothetical protein [Paenibacillus sp.]